MRHLLVALLLCAACAACVACAPGPLSPTEVRWRWRTGELLDVKEESPGVLSLVVRCPAEEGGRTVRFKVASAEVRTFERLRPFSRPDALNLVGWRRCGDPSTPLAVPLEKTK